MTSVFESDIDNCYWNGDFKFKETNYFRPCILMDSLMKPQRPDTRAGYYERNRHLYHNLSTKPELQFNQDDDEVIGELSYAKRKF